MEGKHRALVSNRNSIRDIVPVSAFFCYQRQKACGSSYC